jgi:hypothetical protein
MQKEPKKSRETYPLIDVCRYRNELLVLYDDYRVVSNIDIISTTVLCRIWHYVHTYKYTSRALVIRSPHSSGLGMSSRNTLVALLLTLEIHSTLQQAGM